MLFEFLESIKNAGCIIKDRFNIYCPGCGGTRAIEALLKLHPLQSLYYNPVVIMLIITVVSIITIKIWESKHKDHKLYKEKLVIYRSFIIILVAFSFVRNCLLIFFDTDMLGDFS